MENLWAPWRIDYILGKTKEEGCIFCTKPRSQEDDDNLIVHRGAGAFTMMNKYPYNNGHLLVAPYKHVPDPCMLGTDENALLMDEVCKAIRVLRTVMKAHGFNVGLNLGDVAGAGIEEHLHYHVVPRWRGDVNFMPVLADVRVIPEHLRSTCKKLRACFDSLFPENPEEVEK
jgi:ATP adenylyltransferase